MRNIPIDTTRMALTIEGKAQRESLARSGCVANAAEASLRRENRSRDSAYTHAWQRVGMIVSMKETGSGGVPTNDESIRLRIATEERDGVVVVALSGEFDIAGSNEVIAALDGAAARAPRCLVVDLGQLRFMDSSGIHALHRAKDRADEQGHRLAIVRSPALERIFELTEGLELRFDLVDHPAEVGLTPAGENERERRGDL